MRKKMILLGLNELNLDFIKYYCSKGLLPNFDIIIKNGYAETFSETEYHLLEPWIQWVTVYTGKTFSEHQVYRLGDIVERPDLSQLFEELEAENLTVGAVSPFNAANRLKNAAFFIPDPWTDTKVTGSPLIEKLSDAVKQLVNDNAQSKISPSSVMALLQGMISFVPPNRYAHYLQLAMDVRKPGVRAMILDNLLSDIFLKLWHEKKPDFSYMFLNAGAHIQHHYLYNSEAYQGNIKNPEWYCKKGYDPLLRVLKEYDLMIGKLLGFGQHVLMATGLHQAPHNHLTYYWRLNNHAEFLKGIGIDKFSKVQPRMSRDFLIEFDREEDCLFAEQILSSFKMKGDEEPIFNADNRGKSLFVELVYPNEISPEMAIYNETHNISSFKQIVTFVAIKNGEHHGMGYLLSNEALPKGSIPLTAVYKIIKEKVFSQVAG